MLRFFALHSVHQDTSFELSKSTIGQFFGFFTIRGDPFDFGGFRALRAGEGLFKNGFQSVFLGPYGIPHAYKCQARNIFKDYNLSIRLSGAARYDHDHRFNGFFLLTPSLIQTHAQNVNKAGPY